MSFSTDASGFKSIGRSSRTSRVRVKTLSKSFFFVSAFIEGFVKFPHDAHVLFFLQTVLDLQPVGGYQCYHLQNSLFYFCVSLSPIAIMVKKPRSSYWVMIIFATLTLIGFILLMVVSKLFGNVDDTADMGIFYVVLGLLAFTATASGGKWFWTRRAFYEQHRFPREIDDYLRGLLIIIVALNLGRVTGTISTYYACRDGPSINYVRFYGILILASVAELLMLLFGSMIIRKGSSSNPTTAVILKREMDLYFQRKRLPENTVVGTIASILPLYIPVLFIMAYRDQKFSRFVRQAELLDLQVSGNLRVHPTLMNVVEPMTILILVVPFQKLLALLSRYEISFRTSARTLCAFAFMTLSYFSGSLVQVFIEDRARESINVHHGCLVVYNTLECMATVSTELRVPTKVNPMSHSIMISNAQIDILRENNKPMNITASCGSTRTFAVETLLEVKAMQISEYLLVPLTDGTLEQNLIGIELKKLPPRKITSVFFFANTIRQVYTTRYNMTIRGEVARYYARRKLNENSNSPEVFPDGRYSITVNGIILHELEISKGTSLTILITKNIKRNLKAVPLTRVIEIVPSNVIAFYYQFPQIIFQGLADLMTDTPGFIYASNLVAYEWREALQLMWYFTEAAANLLVATGLLEFHTPLYNFMMGFCVSGWSSIFFVEVTRRFYTYDYEKSPDRLSDDKTDDQNKSS